MKIDGARRAARAANAAYRAGTRAAETTAARAGDSSSVLGIPEAELTPKVRTAIETLMAEVERLRQELAGQQQRIAMLERLADEDTLVPVANRRAFVRELSRLVAFAERYDGNGAVLYFDIDDMKGINDRHGHGAGDAALALVANLLVENVRESDIVGRLGGDEFGVLLAQADTALASEKAERLAETVRDHPLIWQDQSIAINLSYGAYAFRGGENASLALEAADRAMYEKKPLRRTG